MSHNFNEVIDRRNTSSLKWDFLEAYYGDPELKSMWVADSDFIVPQQVINNMMDRTKHGIFGYTVRPAEFYQSIADWVEKRHQWKIEKDWVVYTPGVVAAINWAVLTYTNPGDKVIIQSPVYYPFGSSVSTNNRVLIENNLVEDTQTYKMDFDDLRSQIDKDTKLLILCNPHNPVGRVWKKEELIELGKICHENDILILSDEIHSDLVLGENKHIPIASLSKELEEITITCYAPSKTFNVAGLVTAVAVIPNKELKEQFVNFQTSIGVTMSNIYGIEGFVSCYRHGESWLAQQLEYLKENVAYFEDFIQENMPKLKVFRPEGTYLLWLDCRELGMTVEELNDFFIKSVKVALDSGNLFGENGKGFMRFNLATPRSNVEQLLTDLKEAYDTLNVIQ